MIYCSIDIETTGLDPVNNQILEIGAILYKAGVGEIDRFHCFVVHDTYVGSAYALHMNREILYKIANKQMFEDQYDFLTPRNARKAFGAWLYKHKSETNDGSKLTPAGKNFASFDRQFLFQLMSNLGELISHTTLDPGTFFAKASDSRILSLGECLERAGMPTMVTHNALDDAQQIIDLLEYQFTCSVVKNTPAVENLELF